MYVSNRALQGEAGNIPIEVLALDKKIGEAPERQMAPDQVTGLGDVERELCRPSHFKQADTTLWLESRVVDGQQLSGLRVLVQ